MKNDFYPGQRVRAIRGPSDGVDVNAFSLAMVGKHGVIDGDRYLDDGIWRWPVQWDLGPHTDTAEGWIEPIYDGSQKISWSECAWQPTREKA